MHENLSYAERITLIMQWITDEPMTKRELRDRISDTWGLSNSQAFRCAADARSRLAMSNIGEQLITGMLALHAAHRCAIKGEQIMNDMAEDEQLASYRERLHRTVVRQGDHYLRVATACITLKPTDVMTDSEGKELLLNALEETSGQLSSDDIQRLMRALGGTTAH